MSSSREEVVNVAASVCHAITESEVADYVSLLSKAKASFEEVEAMEDYQPTPDIDSSSRINIYLPEQADNPLGGWAYRCICPHSHPTSDLLKGRSGCLKDNIAMAGVPRLLGISTFTDWAPKTDATVVTRTFLHGSTINKKVVCENLSSGAVSCTAGFGPVDNPYAKGYSAGGSSSGTAALYMDSSGAVWTLWDEKNDGLVHYTGIASNDASLDYLGPMTTNFFDCAKLLEAISGVDGLDDRQIAGTPLPNDVPKYSEILPSMNSKHGVKDVKIGILKD